MVSASLVAYAMICAIAMLSGTVWRTGKIIAAPTGNDGALVGRPIGATAVTDIASR